VKIYNAKWDGFDVISISALELQIM